MILRHITAAMCALLRSVQYAQKLHIRGGEWKRYLKKSLSLGLCYAGFGYKEGLKVAWKAGEAAFFCCAYDVVTDWRHFDPKAREAFETILHARELEPQLQSLAIGLYEKEIFNNLENDGLDRGAIALRFTLKLMGCEKNREAIWGNVDEVGRLLQIVDDVLDYEADIACGDINCLTSVRGTLYLRQLLKKLNSEESKKIFGKGNSILVKVIGQAERKAKILLNADDKY